jgi:nucleosome binding factor SPN SPT16 subunit
LVKSVHNKFKDEELVKYLPKNFGYGIGMTIKEEMLCLKSDNKRIIEAGMCFNVRVSLVDFQEGKPAA